VKLDSTLSPQLESVDILRHGLIDGHNGGRPRFIGSTDNALSSLGWRQMQNAVDNSDRQWDLIVSSPLRRCSDFAEYLASSRQIPCQILTGFREYHFGVWEGQFVDDIAAREAETLKRFWEDPQASAPIGAESMEEFSRRVIASWENVAAYSGYRRVLIISHAGVMRMLRCHLGQLSLRDFLSYQPGYGEFLHVDNHSTRDLSSRRAIAGHRESTCAL